VTIDLIWKARATGGIGPIPEVCFARASIKTRNEGLNHILKALASPTERYKGRIGEYEIKDSDNEESEREFAACKGESELQVDEKRGSVESAKMAQY
jgi:hypothetical protein